MQLSHGTETQEMVSVSGSTPQSLSKAVLQPQRSAVAPRQSQRHGKFGGREYVVDTPRPTGSSVESSSCCAPAAPRRSTRAPAYASSRAVLGRRGLAPTACGCQLRRRPPLRRLRMANDLRVVRRTARISKRQMHKRGSAFGHGTSDPHHASATPPLPFHSAGERWQASERHGVHRRHTDDRQEG